MSHPDFRLNGKIFATPRDGELTGMVKLTPEQQKELIEEDPRAFSAESGAWGRIGCTKVVLSRANEDMLGRALTWARDRPEQRQRRGSLRRRHPRPLAVARSSAVRPQVVCCSPSPYRCRRGSSYTCPTPLPHRQWGSYRRLRRNARCASNADPPGLSRKPRPRPRQRP